jgi:hypothetical protein
MTMKPRWSIVDDLPRSLSIDDYREAQALVETLCLRHGVEGGCVGFFGSIGCPGISDIDVVIVGDGHQLTRVVEDFASRCSDSSWLRSMFRHPPLFLLDDCVEFAPRLHTLVGLSEPLRGRIFDRAEPGGTESLAGTSYDAVLHAMWMTFLINFVAGLGRRGSISARTLLLVHKNLEYSERYFGGFGADDRSYCSPVQHDSETIRRLTLEGRAVQHLASDFIEQFEAALHAFAGFRPEGPEHRRVAGPPALLHDDLVCIRGSRTAVRRLGPRRFATAEPWLFEATRRYVEADQGDDDIGEFIRASIRAREPYRRAGLRYPFVGPFGLSPPLASYGS